MKETDLQRLNENSLFTILIIDDMESMRRELIADLRYLKFTGKIIEIETLAKAKEALDSKYFDLVICDRNLADGSGVNFLISLRAHSRFSKVPLIMCTTVNDLQLIAYAITQGANEYITKPWTKEILVTKILNVFPVNKS